jgi:hypothetical protein
MFGKSYLDAVGSREYMLFPGLKENTVSHSEMRSLGATRKNRL